MIVPSIDIMRAYVPTIASKIEFSQVADFLLIAQNEISEMLLGSAIEELLDSEIEDDHVELLDLVRRAISLSAFLNAIPELDLRLSANGFVVQSNQDVSPASRQRVDTLIQSLKKRKDDEYDRIVLFLLRSEAYSDWRTTPQFLDITKGLVFTLRGFNSLCVETKHKNALIPTNWTDFYALLPKLNMALFQNVAPYVSPEYCTELLEKLRQDSIDEPIENIVAVLIKKAVVAFAIDEFDLGFKYTADARAAMLPNIGKFPTFANSKQCDLDPEVSDEEMQKLKKATIANFL